jgi:hypothetical protein
MLYADTTAPDVGVGPYSVEHSEADGFYHLTLNGERVAARGPYPLGKTAYRTARKLNEDIAADAEVIRVTTLPKARDEAPKVKVTVAKPGPKLDKKIKETVAKKAAPKVEPTPAAKAGKATHSTVVFQGTREEWLNAFTAAARPIFAKAEFPLPNKVRVSVGFPLNSRGGKVIGQCWSTDASADGINEIFVTPTLDDTGRIADVLTHELCHAATPGAKHGPKFKQCATAVGLEGKMTATTAGAGWHEWADPILADLGPIPHASLDPNQRGVKKQTTRLIKCACDDCGFTFRTTAKWISGKELQCPDPECLGTVTVATEGE